MCKKNTLYVKRKEFEDFKLGYKIVLGIVYFMIFLLLILLSIKK